DLVRYLAVLEEQEGRDAQHVVLLGDVLVRVDVQLADLQLALVLGRQLIDERREVAARSTPGRPEIHQDGLRGAQHLALEVIVGEGCYIRARHSMSSSRKV